MLESCFGCVVVMIGSYAGVMLELCLGCVVVMIGSFAIAYRLLRWS